MEVTQKQFARKKPDQLVYLELGSGNGGMLLSISEDGFRFRAVSPLRANGLMPFAFSFDGSRRLQGIGEVEWLDDDGKSGGMRFVEVSPDFRSELDQWLALEPRRGKSGRETAPSLANPPDSMEKIREELRRGYPLPVPRDPIEKESAAAVTADSPAKSKAETPPEKPAPKVRLGDAEPGVDPAEREKPSATLNHPAPVAEPREKRAEVRAALPTANRERRSPPSPQQGRPSVDRKPPVEPSAQRFYPPPFTLPAESETPASLNQASSAFIKKPPAVTSTPPEKTSFRASFEESPPAAAIVPVPPASREPAHNSAEALRRPFRQESRSAYSDRPYIPPPIEQSYDAAWERAKLTVPPESPRLSRAAAGSIIGAALAVILGAMAFNFRQDIGQLVIDVGQRISGEQGTPAPSVPSASDTKPGSQTPSESSGSESANRPDAAAGAGSPAAQPSGGAKGSADSNSSNVPTPPRDTPSPSATRGSNPATSAAGTLNRSAAGAPSSSAPPARSVGSSPNSPSAAEAESEPGNGQEEFNSAREMLRGDHRHRDLSRAVDLLWAGVRKGYVPAEVTLADLYRRGDGVAKNCDQAQVLLVAASKKGSPEARQMLEQMAEEGCTE